MAPDESTWTEEQDAQYARRVGELHLEGHAEFEVEEIAAAEVNAGRDGDATTPPAEERPSSAAPRRGRRRRPIG